MAHTELTSPRVARQPAPAGGSATGLSIATSNSMVIAPPSSRSPTGTLTWAAAGAASSRPAASSEPAASAGGRRRAEVAVPGGGGAAPGGDGAKAPGTEEKKDNVVDAEFVDVDDKK